MQLRKSCISSAVGVAAITAQGIAVVARFAVVLVGVAVAAAEHALAVAAVAVHIVAVVADLALIDKAVATDREHKATKYGASRQL